MLNSLADFIALKIEALRVAGVDNPSLDARLLICHALGCDRLDLLTQRDRVLNHDEILSVEKLIDRRIKREPVARIIGMREFWGLPFGLNEATLEPRPDSETLIEVAVRLVRPMPSRILDLGTGTGCLLLALLHEFKEATGVGVDLAPRAVAQAKSNAENLEMADRASFIENNWIAGLDQSFDLIVSNPPYIESADIDGLMPEVKEYDPMLALDGGDDGLAPYRFLTPKLQGLLNPSGWVIFEIGIRQAPAVVGMMEREGFLSVTTFEDYGGVVRCVAGKKAGV